MPIIVLFTVLLVYHNCATSVSRKDAKEQSRKVKFLATYLLCALCVKSLPNTKLTKNIIQHILIRHLSCYFA
jgi:hypothetical protein